MSESPGVPVNKEAEEKTVKAMADTHQALEVIMEAVTQMGGQLKTVVEELAKHQGDILELKRFTPHKELRPLGNMIPEDDRSKEEADRLPDYDLSEERPRKSMERRDSYKASDTLATLAEEVRRSRSGAEMPAPVTLLHIQQVVPPHQQVESVSITALIVALEHQAIFINQHSQNKNLVYFFTPNAHKELIKNEESMSIPISLDLTAAKMFMQPDDVIRLMVARYVRKRYTGTRIALTKTLMSFARRLTAVSQTWKFSIVGYDKMLHNKMVEWLKSMRRGWRHLNEGITVREKNMWPPEKSLLVVG